MSTLSADKHAEFVRELAPNIITLSRGGPLSGAVADYTKKAAELAGEPVRHNEVRVPLDLLLAMRALTANVYGSGGAFVGSQIGSFDPLPRASSVALQMGAQLLTGLTGNLSYPRQTGAETLSWLHETDTVSSTDSTFGALNLTPHRLSGAATISGLLQAQTGGLAGKIVIESLGIGVAKAVDRAVLVGSGVAGEPEGLHYAANVGTKTFGGSASQTILADMKSTILGADANRATCGWVCHPDVEEKWSTLFVNGTGSAKSLWDVDRNTVVGLPALTTTAAPATGALVGNWSTVVIAFFGESVSVLVNPFAQALADKISFVINAYADTGCLRPTQFVRNADTVVA
jgi:HK97 family phage major capsid protein